MNRIEELLKWVQRTNPSISKKKLIEELSKSKYSTVGLITVCGSSGRA